MSTFSPKILSFALAPNYTSVNDVGLINGKKLVTAYNIPAGTGAGKKVGIISLGGGYLQSDLNLAMQDIGLVAPTITFVSVDGAQNNFNTNPYTPDGLYSIENTLDLFCVASVAPNATIRMYTAPNSMSGFKNAIIRACDDGCDVISVSWGGAELGVSSEIASWETTLATKTAGNITICVASGDYGSTPGPSDGFGVLYPAASKSVIAVGGTVLTLNSNNTRLDESVDYATGLGSNYGGGGGVSTVVSLPTWQNGLTYKTYPDGVIHNLTKRGLPDVSMAMNDYGIRFNGNIISVIGTSASAPIFAGMIARLIAKSGTRPAALHNVIYANTNAFYDVLDGNNATNNANGYYATATWDPVTGMGVPNGQLLYNAIYPPTTYTLTVTKTGTGNGTITSLPAGINGPGTATFAAGTVVTLTGAPQANSSFAGWLGAATGTGSASIIMNANKTVTATFNAINVPSYTITTAPTQLSEGATAPFVVTTTNVSNNATLYWRIVNGASNFTQFSGSFTVTSNSGTFTVTPNTNTIVDGNRTFVVEIKTVSTNGVTVATSNPITIVDINTYPVAGTELSTFCRDYDQWAMIADGAGGQAEQLKQADSTNCGYDPTWPVKDSIISEGCVPGTHTYRVTRADGHNGTVNENEINSIRCGYQPVGTPVGDAYCKGVDRYQNYSDGYGGIYNQLIEKNSTVCGYVPRVRPPETIPMPTKEISEHWYNTLTTEVNELFGDVHAGEGPSADQAVQDNSIKWGWGGENVNLVQATQKITATHTNKLVNRINLSTLRTGSSDQELVIVSQGSIMTDEFFKTATDLLDTAREIKNTVEPSLTELSVLGSYNSVGNWTNILETKIALDFGNYEDARHFFNAGGDIRLSFATQNGYGSGYHNWRCIFWDQGTLKLNVDSLSSLNTRGITQDRGFAKLIEEEQLLYTSPSASGGGYGGYGGHGGYGGYGGYASSRLKVYGSIIADKLILRVILDNSGLGIRVRGTMKMSVAMAHPLTVTENNVTLTLPVPAIELTQGWTEI